MVSQKKILIKQKRPECPCKEDAGGRVPRLRVSIPPSRFERWMMKQSRASQHE